MIVLDVSPSMAAKDMGNDRRFNLAQAAIMRFIRARENDMLGIISFGKDAAIRSPLTKDYQFLEKVIEQVKILEHGDGTSIGTALALAALHLKEVRAQEKNVILITDGDNNSGEIHPDAAIAILRELGVKVFVIGLGRQGNNNVVVENPYTNEVLQGFVRNAYNEELLEKIAYRTGGQFFKAETIVTFESLFQIIDSQNSGERRFKLMPVVQEHSDFLYSFLLIIFAIQLFVRFVILREAL
ncbi:MAG: VWA domain-containing protein [Spirochaetia bacterium]